MLPQKASDQSFLKWLAKNKTGPRAGLVQTGKGISDNGVLEPVHTSSWKPILKI